MPKKFSFREWWKEERAKLSEMSFKKAVKYIWQYYWIFILGFIGLTWFLVFFIHRLLVGAPDYWIYASFANSTATSANVSRFRDDFAAFSGWDLKEKRIEFSANMFFDYNHGRIKGNEYYNNFVALADTGTLDIITMDPEQLADLGQSGRLMNWNFEECDALREKYADRLIWYKPPEDAEINEQKPSLRAMNYIISQNPSLSVEDYLFVGDRNDRDGASAQLVNMDYCDIKQFISVIKNAEKSEK